VRPQAIGEGDSGFVGFLPAIVVHGAADVSDRQRERVLIEQRQRLGGLIRREIVRCQFDGVESGRGDIAENFVDVVDGLLFALAVILFEDVALAGYAESIRFCEQRRGRGEREPLAAGRMCQP